MVPSGRRPNRIRKHRRIKGYSQIGLAKVLGMKTASLICEWEHGRVAPTLDRALDLYLVLQIPIEELFSERLIERRVALGPDFSPNRVINQSPKPKNVNDNERDSDLFIRNK